MEDSRTYYLCGQVFLKPYISVNEKKTETKILVTLNNWISKYSNTNLVNIS